MRVLMLAWEFPPGSVGGVAANVDGLSHALAGAGHDVVVFTLAHRLAPLRSEEQGVRVLRARTELPWLPEDDLVARVASANHHLVQLSADLDGWRPDVVTPTTGRSPGPPTRWPRCTAPASSPRSTPPSGVATPAASRPASPARSTPSSRGWPTAVAEVMASSRFMSNEVIVGFELPAERIHRIPNGIDPTWWSGGEHPARESLVFTWGRVQSRRGSRCWPGR